MTTKIIKWASLPVLLIGSIFSGSAARYELLLDFVVCLGALIVIERSIRARKFFWAAGFVAVVIVFSPLMLVVKIFALMGLTCIGTFVTVLAAWKTEPLPAA